MNKSAELPPIFVVLFFLLVFVGVSPLSASELYEGDPSGGGDSLRQIGYLIVFSGMIFCLQTGDRLPLAMPAPLLVLFLWCWLSLMWAIDPSVAFRRLALTSIVSFCCFASVSLVGPERFVRLLAPTLAAIILADLVSIAVHPNAIQGYTFREDTLVGNWRGLHIEKNAAGAIAGVSVVIFFFTAIARSELLRWGYVLMTALAFFFLYKTQSKTSVIFAPVAIMFGLGYRYLYRNSFAVKTAATLFLGIISIWGIAFLVYFNEIIRAVTDPEAFTGRGMIWNGLVGFISNHWLLGSGYGSFWNISTGSPIRDYTAEEWIAEFVYVGHNGYLDTFAQLGIVGFCLVLLALVITPMREILILNSKPFRIKNTLPFSIIVFCTLHNFQETSFLERDNPLFVLICCSIAMLNIRESKQFAAVIPPQQPNKFFVGSRF